MDDKTEWALVPKEPTPEMCDEIEHASRMGAIWSAASIYRAMIAAAPAAPAAQKRERKLATMWLCAHYADEYTNEQIEALCWEILGIKTRDQAMSIAAPAAPAPLAGLSAEDQEAWDARVRHAKKCRSNVERAILAVDALLRQRSEPQTEAKQLRHCAIAVRDWMAGGCDVNDIPRPHIAVLVEWTNTTVEDALRGTGEAA